MVIGTGPICRPVTWKTALAIAAAVSAIPISPVPLAPVGPKWVPARHRQSWAPASR
jgi:hypothetical protein